MMLEWIISSSVLIIILVILSTVSGGRISRRVMYALWILLLLRLLIPVSIGNSPLSTANVINAIRSDFRNGTSGAEEAENDNNDNMIMPYTPEQRRQTNGSGSQTAAQEAAGENAGNVMPENNRNENAAHVFKAAADFMKIPETLLVIWIAGMIMLAGWFLVSGLRFSSGLRRDRIMIPAAELPEDTGSTLAVYRTGQVETPCLAGLFRPAVYIPAGEAADENTLRHIIVHENAHFRHGDHIWSFFRIVCIVIHWYNPLVWYAAFRSRRDCETACDESALRILGASERTAYGDTLIRVTQKSGHDMLPAAVMMSGTKRTLRERIRLIGENRSRSLVLTAAVILLAVFAAGCALQGSSGKKVVITADYSGIGEEFEIGRDMIAAADEGFTERFELAERTESGQVYTYTFNVENVPDICEVMPAEVFRYVAASGRGSLKAGTYISNEQAEHWLRISSVDIDGTGLTVRCLPGIGSGTLPGDLYIGLPEGGELSADSAFCGYDMESMTSFREYVFTFDDALDEEEAAQLEVRVDRALFPVPYSAEYECKDTETEVRSLAAGARIGTQGIISYDPEDYADLREHDYFMRDNSIETITDAVRDHADYMRNVLSGGYASAIVYSEDEAIAWLNTQTEEGNLLVGVIYPVELVQPGDDLSRVPLELANRSELDGDTYYYTIDLVSASEMGFDALLIAYTPVNVSFTP